MTEPTDKPLLDDQQLEEYLKGDSSVSRQYRQLPGADVPPSLDRLVLRQAEDAVKRPSRPAWMRWTAPLAVAASAVLVVAIVVETGLRDETMVTSQSAQGSMEAKKAAAPAEAPPAAPPKEESPPPVVYVDLNGPRAPTVFAPEMDIVVPEPAPAPAPPPPKLQPPPAILADESPAFAVRPSAPAPAAAPASTEAAQTEEEDKAAFAADSSRQKAAREDLARREQEGAAAQRATRSEQAQAAGAPNAAPATVLSYSRPVSSTAADNVATIQRAYTDPEAWLKDIRQLRKDNKQEEADKEWRRFREAFPEYEVAETDAAREAKR